jgi:hypothetical protein
LDRPSHPCPECQGSGIVSCCDTAGAESKYWQPGLAGKGILRKIEPDDPLPGVWAGNYMKPEDYWADVEKALPQESK